MYQTFYAHEGTTSALPLRKTLAAAVRQADRLPLGYVKYYPSGEVVHVSSGAMKTLGQRLARS